MKMPATTNIKVEAKPPTDVNLGDAAKQCLMCLEKKVRNLEKRKSKIEVNREKALKGTKLEKEQEISLNQYEQVTHDLEFAKELHKQFLTINSEHEKMVKKQAKREKAERQANEIKRICEILQLQSTLDLLGGDQVREDFKTGKHGAVVLTEDNLDQLDKLYQEISPSRDDSGDEYPQKLTTAADHLVNILDGKDRQVLGTTYKELKELLTLINGCGYFEKVKQSEEVEVVEDVEATDEPEELSETAEDSVPENSSQPEEDQEDDLDLQHQQAQQNQQQQQQQQPQQQQPIDLTTDGVKSHLDIAAQPMNPMEQDAFFAPSSTAYQSEPEAQFSQTPSAPPPQQAPDFQSFTDNRPFQFIQASYIMADAQQAPSVVDPAVIHAQPAAASANLQFMSTGYESTSPPSQTSTQPPAPQPTQPQPPNQPSSGLGMGDLNQSSINQSSPPSGSAGPTPPQHPSQGAPQEFPSAPQPYGQPGLQQPEGLFPSSAVDDVTNSLTSHSGLMGQMREDTSSSRFDIPPTIPMPPSQQAQDQSQLDQHQQQQLEEKKFQMNASAPVFQSMYAQQVATGAVPVTVPPPTVPSDSQPGGPPTGGDFNAQNAAGDGFQQGYQGNNGFNNSVYSRSGGRGNYRGSRNGNGGPNPGGPRNGSGGGNSMQNGFGGARNGGPNPNNSRGGRGGYGGYGGQNTGYNSRPDNYQNSYNSGGFGSSYQKRGGMNNPGGPPPNVSNQGYNNRGGAGGMRGGMPRGGGQRGGVRGGFSRPPPNQ